MKNMKQRFNEKVKEQVKKIAANEGEQMIEGFTCRVGVYEAEIPQKLLDLRKKDC